MVNGFFELSSNRRDLWQSGVDMTGDGRTRAQWNVVLMTDVIAPCYIRLLHCLRDRLGFNTVYQGLWPSPSLSSPWNHLAEAVFAMCRMKPLLCVQQQQQPGHEINGNTYLAVHWTSPYWVRCCDAILLPEDDRLSNSDVEHFKSFLWSAKQPLVMCDTQLKLRTALQTSGTCDHIATPALVRQILRRAYHLTPGDSYSPSGQVCSFLLRYCLLGLDASYPSHELDSLPILPLASGDTGVLRVFAASETDAIRELSSMGFSLTQSISALQTSNFHLDNALEWLTETQTQTTTTPDLEVVMVMVYVLCSGEEAEVFEGASRMILDANRIGPNELQFLSSKAIQGRSNVQSFTATLVPDLLRFILPDICLQGKPVEIDQISDEDKTRVLAFIAKFW
eukprot:gene44095-58809_t